MSSDGCDSNSEESVNEENKDERTAIRSELASLSFEELQKLKERIGAKVYNEAVFGKTNKEKNSNHKVFKRENKNRPREMSSKRPVSMLPEQKVKKREIRDPRFDPLCGEFDKKQFSSDYSFLSNVRLKDIQKIKTELKQTNDPDRKEKLHKLLQRLKEQQRVSNKNKIEKQKLLMEKEKISNEIKEGKVPHFSNKSERRVEDLVKQYEELKGVGTSRVHRHIKRRQQKIKKRSSRPIIS